MKYLIYLLLLIILTGLSVGLAPVIAIFGQVPLVLFLLVVVWSLEKQDNDFLLIAFGAGLFMDLSSGNVLGTFTIPLLVVGAAIHLLAENFFAVEFSGRHMAWLVVPAQVLFYVLYFCTSWVFLKLRLPVQVPGIHALTRGFIAACVYNILLLYPMSWLVSGVRVFTRKYIEKEYKIR